MRDRATRIKRRNVFSNPKVQLRIVLTFAIIALLYACTSWYVSVSSLKAISREIQTLELSEAQYRDASIIVRERAVTLNLQLMMQTFVAFVLLTMAGVVLSHHIGGPLYQLSAYLRDIVDDRTKPRRIGFRRHDFFRELPDLFNAFQSKFGILQNDAPPRDDA